MTASPGSSSAGFWRKSATVLAVLVLVEGAAVAWLLADRVASVARADALRQAYEQTQVAFDAAVTASNERVAAVADTAAHLSSEVDRLRGVADSAARLQDALEQTLLADLPDTLRPVLERLREATALEREAFRAAVDSLTRVVALRDRQVTEYKGQIEKYEGRLAEAVARAEASERARRPSALTWLTRAAAAYGGVRLIVDLAAAVLQP